MNTSSRTDQASVKTLAREQWDRVAAGWNAHHSTIRTWLTEATATMLDAARVGSGSHVLDVAAGAGDQTLEIAARVGCAGSVVATDISPRMLELAQRNARRAGYNNVETHLADGEELLLPREFDAVVCRLGLMLYPDPVRGLGQMFSALHEGGCASTVVFSDSEKNPCVATALRVALKHAGICGFDPDSPGGLLSLGKRGRMDALLKNAGFHDVATMTISAPMRLPTTEHYLHFLRNSAGPIVNLMAQLDDTRRATAWHEMSAELRRFETAQGWVGPNELLVSSGCKRPRLTDPSPSPR